MFVRKIESWSVINFHNVLHKNEDDEIQAHFDPFHWWQAADTHSILMMIKWWRDDMNESLQFWKLAPTKRSRYLSLSSHDNSIACMLESEDCGCGTVFSVDLLDSLKSENFMVYLYIKAYHFTDIIYKIIRLNI